MTLPELKQILFTFRHYARYGGAGQDYDSIQFLNDGVLERGNLIVFHSMGLENRVVVLRLAGGRFMVMTTDRSCQNCSIWIPYGWNTMNHLLPGQSTRIGTNIMWGWKVSGF